MIKDLKNVNTVIDLSKIDGVAFGKLRVSFKSYSKKNILKLASILKNDEIESKTVRSFFYYKLTCKIDLIDKFCESEYQTIVGKFSILASKCFVYLDVMGVE
ncbi:hypothetical protein [Ferruginibacter sp.]